MGCIAFAMQPICYMCDVFEVIGDDAPTKTPF